MDVTTGTLQKLPGEFGWVSFLNWQKRMNNLPWGPMIR